MKPGADHVLWGTFNDPNQFAFHFYHDAGAFYGVPAESSLYSENAHRFLGNVSAWCISDWKGKINRNVYRSAGVRWRTDRAVFLG